MKKLTLKQLDVLCECGHERREHSDDISGNQSITQATEECIWPDCLCSQFDRAEKSRV